MNKYKLGFMVGRFQMLHKGHELLINEGLAVCDRFVLLIGNSEESRTEKNPFTFEERKEMIKKIYGDKIEVYPIINIGIGYIPAWGNYIMNTIKFYCGLYPDFTIRGNDNGRNDWIDKEKFPFLTELIISRNLIKYSATEIRSTLKAYAENLNELREALKEQEYGLPTLESTSKISQISFRANVPSLRARLVELEASIKDKISNKFTNDDIKSYGNLILNCRG